MADSSSILPSDDRQLVVMLLRWPVLERVKRDLRRTHEPLERRAVAVVGYEFVYDEKDVPEGEDLPPNTAPRHVVVAFAPPNTAAFSLATGRCTATPDWMLDDASLGIVRAERKRRWRRTRKSKSATAATAEEVTPEGTDLGAFLGDPPANEVASA